MDEGLKGNAEHEDCGTDWIYVLDARRISLFCKENFTMRTMKLHHVGKSHVLIMIDCGKSHNFIAWELVKQIGWNVSQTTPFGVRLGDRHQIFP